MCKIGEREPLFFWKSREEKYYSLETQCTLEGIISSVATEEVAIRAYGPGELLISVNGELKGFR